ncbi:MAG: choice-of-anchor L domain-containing protein [Bacteroidia bacterium]
MLFFAINNLSKKPLFFFEIVLLFFPVALFSQMTVSPNNTATALAQAVAGSGVNVTNATINCGANAAGTFSFSGPNLGLTGGIILTTGTAVDAANPGLHLCSINNGNNFSDPDLTAIVPTADLDVCVLEFDFVPTCDSLKMAFVFGSEEYPQGVNLQYNDAFAIFLTGPNPSGGNYTAQNIATLPNGTPVSIHNVNAATNTAYFHNNYSTPNNNVAYNGYTIPVTSVTSVAPCSTYHVKFAIADAGNALYDSGVFISNNTLSCQTPAVLSVNTTASSGCNNTGSATVTVSNYTGTPTYHWSPGNQNTATINNLASGAYTCTVSMHQTCGIITQTITASVATSGSTIVLTSTQHNLVCNGGSNASATIAAIGGTSPYTCTWSTNPAQTGMTASNLSAGSYTATVNDNGGCHANIQVIIPAPAVMQVSVGTTSTTCTGSIGTASVNVLSNGHAPYTYTWSTTPVQNTQTATNLSHNTYTVFITDANTCTTTATATIPIQPIGWSVSATATNVACYGGSKGVVSANISTPGANTFTYVWNTNPTQSSQAASNLSMGNYTCTVTDNNGCALTTTISITQPSLLTSSINSLPTLCTGSVGSATVNASGGTQPYTYTWNIAPTQTTATINNLAQGQYTATISDAHNCTTNTVVTVGVINPVLQITTSVVNSVCGGPSGSINVTSVTPSAPPYIYNWAPGGQTTQSISNLSPSTYSVSITDANGCVGNTSATVGTNTFFPIQITTSPDYCGKSIGSATAIPHANPPYQYQWNITPAQFTQSATDLSPGNYMVIVTDGFNPNCKDSVAVVIGDIPPLAVPISTTPTFCDRNFGSATASPIGFPPYNYQWSGYGVSVQNTASINNLFIGTYTVQVSDLYNCVATATATIYNQNDVLIPSIKTDPSGDVYSLTPVTISISTNPGWTLNSGALSDGTSLGLNTNYTFNQSGDYIASYYFTSNHGCIDSVKYDIHVIDYSTLYIPNSFTPNNDGKNDFFKADGTFINSFEMYIYDRWGNLVITLDDINKSWNGKHKGQEAPEDIYIYKGSAIDTQGKTINFHGQINLIR